VRLFPKPKLVSNWIMGDFMRLLKQEEGATIKVSPGGIADLLSEIEKGTLSTTMAKEVMEEMFRTGRMAEEVIKENPKAVKDWQKGKLQVAKFLVGKLMQKTRGKANPQMANQIIEQKLKSLSGEEK